MEENKNNDKKIKLTLKNIFIKIYEKKEIILKGIITFWFIWYIYRVHDYLGEFRITFQWCIFILFIIWLIFPCISEIELFGNKIKMKELKEKIDRLEENDNFYIQKEMQYHEMQIGQEQEMESLQKIENKQSQVQNNTDGIDFKSKLFSYQIVFELKLVSLNKKLLNKSNHVKNGKINIFQILWLLFQKELISKDMYEKMAKMELTFGKEIVNYEDYKFVQENYKNIMNIIDEIYKMYS